MAGTFPSLPGLDISVHMVPIFKSEIQVVDSGKELRRQVWATPRYRFVLKLNALRKTGFQGQVVDEVATLLNFIIGQGGNVGTFTYTNPNDGTTWTCRFDQGGGSGSSGGTEEFDFEQLVYNLWSLSEVNLVTVK